MGGVVYAEINEKPAPDTQYDDYVNYDYELQIYNYPTSEKNYYFNKGAEIGGESGGTGNAVLIGDDSLDVTFHVGKAEGKDYDLSLVGKDTAVEISTNAAFHIKGENTNILLGAKEWDSYNDEATIYLWDGANFTVDAANMQATGGAETNLKLFDNATAAINLSGDFVSDAGGTGIANQNIHADSYTHLTINANNISLSTTDLESADRKAGMYLLAYGDGGSSTMDVDLYARENLSISGFKRGIQTFGSADVDLKGKNVTVSAVNDTSGAGMYLRGYDAEKSTVINVTAQQNAKIVGSEYGIRADDRVNIQAAADTLTVGAADGWSVCLFSGSKANFIAEQAQFYNDLYVEASEMNAFADENVVFGQAGALEGGIITFDSKAQDGTGSASVITTGQDAVTAVSDTYDDEKAVLSDVTFKQAAYINAQGVDAQGQADESYHADKQGSAIRAMRNSAITLDKATGIYGDIIAGKGGVDEEEGADLDTLDWQGGHVKVTSVDGAIFKGDVLAGNKGTIDLKLNGASYEGRVDDYADATLKDVVFRPEEFDVDVTEGGTVNMTLNDSVWTARGQSFVSSVAFGETGGVIDLTKEEGNSVTIRELSGDGTFHMLLNSEDHGKSDMLYIGKNSGHQTINVVGGITGGVEHISEENPLRFATVGIDGDELLPDVQGTEVRAYTRGAGVQNLEYYVDKEAFDADDTENEAYNGEGDGKGTDKPGNDFVENELAGDREGVVNWVITGVKSAQTSDAGKTVIAMSKVNYSNAVYMDRLNKRMGEARYLTGDDGLWVRMRHDRIGKDDAFRSMNTMFEIGYDWKDEGQKDGTHYRGFAFDYMRGTADYQNVAGDGDVRRGGLWYHDTWMGDAGHYTDYVVKYGRLSNDFDIYSELGEKISGDYDNDVWSVSAEYGRKKDMGSDWYFEPQAQLQYAYVTDASYTTSQGTKVDLDAIDSLIGRAGFRIGRDTSAGNTVYFKADILHEFLGDQDIRARDTTGVLSETYENEGTWYDVGFGFSHRMSEDKYMFLDVEHSFGNDNEDTYQVNIGLNMAF